MPKRAEKYMKKKNTEKTQVYEDIFIHSHIYIVQPLETDNLTVISYVGQKKKKQQKISDRDREPNKPKTNWLRFTFPRTFSTFFRFFFSFADLVKHEKWCQFLIDTNRIPRTGR